MQNTFNFQHKNNVNKQLEAYTAFLFLSHKLNAQLGALEFIFPLLAFWGHLQGIPPCNNLVCVGRRIAYTRENCQIVEEVWILQLVKKKKKFIFLIISLVVVCFTFGIICVSEFWPIALLALGGSSANSSHAKVQNCHSNCLYFTWPQYCYPLESTQVQIKQIPLSSRDKV